MLKLIQQSVVLPATPERLYEMYLDPVLHAAFTGAPAMISEVPGSEFRAFGGTLGGKMLDTLSHKLIVHSWRASHWTAADLDSTLILTFWPDAVGGRIDLTHVNVAEHDFEGVTEGWEKYYWGPWRAYLRQG